MDSQSTARIAWFLDGTMAAQAIRRLGESDFSEFATPPSRAEFRALIASGMLSLGKSRAADQS